MLTKKQFSRGFTIVELVIVTIIITILATITFIVYTTVQTKVLNATIASDAENINSSEILFKLSHSAQAKAYYSGNGPDDDLNFKPTGGNIVDVVVSGKDYCIRVYNPMGTKNSITNAYLKESSAGVCDKLPPSNQVEAIPSQPIAPVITVILDNNNVLATIVPVTCDLGSAQYQFSSRTNDGTWSSYSAWSSTTTSTQPADEGVKYGYQAQARCYISYTGFTSTTSTGIEVTYTRLYTPSTPVTAVVLNGNNIQATITPITCVSGNIQYRINSRVNDGSWSGYSAWSSTNVATQTANEGVKYGYQAQARCYTDSTAYSSIVTGSEGTYTSPITMPATPVVASSTTAGYSTTFSWGVATCASGTTVGYQYRFTVSPSGFDSGWTATTDLSATFTTSTGDQTYTLQTQAQCNTAIATSGWTASGTASYYCISDSNPIATSISGYWSTAPTGYMLEDGTAISRTTYADLFAAIGTTYGIGDGSTTFNLPDSRGRVTVNKNPTDTEFDTMGEKFGEKAHTLTGAESGEKGHNHIQDAHSHTGYSSLADVFSNASSNNWGAKYGSPEIAYNQDVATSVTINSNTATNQAVSASNASSSHNTIQPSIVKVFAIKYVNATSSNSMLSPATSIAGYFTTAPSGYLSEDGSAVSRTTYSDLFAAIGTTYGAGDGSTTFNLPDSRGRVAVNKSPTDTEFDVLGEKYGEKIHTDTAAESGLKGHNHLQNAHNHSASMFPGDLFSNAGGNGWGVSYGSPEVPYNQDVPVSVTVNGTTATNQAVAASSASSAHNTIQPSIVKMFVIKYTPVAGTLDNLSKGTSISGYWATAPSGYLLEDGTAISRATYPSLFTAIGTAYGTGDGSTTFNLPDSRGRVVVNKNPSDTEFDTLGEKFGEKSHLLTGAESGEKGHNHTQNAHSHTGSISPSDVFSNASTNIWGARYGSPEVPYFYDTGISITINSTTATNQAVASSNAASAHNNIQPSIVQNFAIRY